MDSSANSSLSSLPDASFTSSTAATVASSAVTTTRTIADCVREYNTQREVAAKGTDKTNIEFEVRLRGVSRDMFVAVAGFATAGSVVSHTADIIMEKPQGTKDFSKLVYTIAYDGAKRVETYTRKVALRTPIIQRAFIDYKVSLASETPIGPFPYGGGSLLRLKNRMSTVLSDSWRLDLTAVKSGVLKDFSHGLPAIREKFFPQTTTATWIDTLPWDLIDSFEVELEYVGTVPLTMDHFATIKQVFSRVNPNYNDDVRYQQAVYSVASLLHTGSMLKRFTTPAARLKQLANQVQSLSLNSYYEEVWPVDGMYATDKADGERVIVDVVPGATAAESTLRIIGSGIYTTTINATRRICVDAEKIGPRVYVFDVLALGDNLAPDAFEKRIAAIPAACAELNALGASLDNIPLEFIPKKYIQLGGDAAALEAQFREIVGDEGCIITRPGSNYIDTANYKWKPYSHNNIDFLAVKCPKKLLGTAPYVAKPGAELYLLFVGIEHSRREKMGLGLVPYYKELFPAIEGTYYPIQFSPAVAPIAYLYWHVGDSSSPTTTIDRKIIELSRSRDNTAWIFHRVREDRLLERGYYGNDFRVATVTYMNYIDVFEFEHLWKRPASYFTRLADDIWRAGNKFRRFVISLLMRDNFTAKRWVVDLASGRGADTHRCQEIRVENALFVDSDKSAIAELVRRWVVAKSAQRKRVKTWLGSNEGLAVRQNGDLVVKDNKNLTVHAAVRDLTTPYVETLRAFEEYGVYCDNVNGVVCNFALHYFCGAMKDLENILALASKLLKRGEVFLFTVLDGERVHELLKPIEQGASWSIFESVAGVSTPKYAIRKDYAGAKLLPVGQRIAVKVPFAEGWYEEPLCNITAVVSAAKGQGLALERRGSMLEYIDQFRTGDRALYDRLTEDDKMYSGLHSFVTLRKVGDDADSKGEKKEEKQRKRAEKQGH